MRVQVQFLYFSTIVQEQSFVKCAEKKERIQSYYFFVFL